MQTKLNFNIPKLNFSRELKQIADRVIIPDIHARMFKGIDIEGSNYLPLAESTKKARSRKGHGFQHLKDTGDLRRSIRSVSRSSLNAVKITFIGGRRDNITNKRLARILQTEGVRSKKYGRRKFSFFGISDRAHIKGLNFMRNEIIKRLNRAK